MTESTQNQDEIEVLISKKDSNSPDSIGNMKKSHKPTAKYAAHSMYGILMICVGTLMYGVMGTVIRLSMEGNESVAYNSNAALVLAECGKFSVTLFLLFYLHGITGGLQSIVAVPFQEWFLFSVPAIIYSITNNLEFYILRYMDPGSLGVLQQTKIITTALLWWYCFKQNIDTQQWVAIALLFFGTMLVAWPGDNDKGAQMYVEWPMGPILIGTQVCLSAIAGIYTEFVYKKYGCNRSIHVDNLSMYFWGSLSNMLQFYYVENNNMSLIDGFNTMTYALIINYMLLGLCLAYVMKYFTNIIKLFMSGFAIIVSGLLTFFIFNLSWTLLYCIGLLVVVSAVVLYKSPKKYIK